MGAFTDDHLLTPPAMELQGNLVRHGPRRHEERRLLADQLGRPFLEPSDGGVLPEDVVSHLGLGHGTTHGLGGSGDGV
jgi:hypothetical protein